MVMHPDAQERKVTSAIEAPVQIRQAMQPCRHLLRMVRCKASFHLLEFLEFCGSVLQGLRNGGSNRCFAGLPQFWPQMWWNIRVS